jgi:hypothetical protein
MQMRNKPEDFKYLYGYQTRETEIGVNVEKLWKDTKGRGRVKEKNFIENFCKVMTHEELHREIFYAILELYEPKEELIVDKISKSNRLVLK